MKWLGIGGEFFHDSGITLLDENGNIEFATLSERFSGKKHDAFIPAHLLKHYITIKML